MQTKEGRTLGRQTFVNVLDVIRVAHVIGGGTFEAWAKLENIVATRITGYELRTEIHLKILLQNSAIPRVGNMPAIHDFTKNVAQVVPGDLVVGIEVGSQDIRANEQIASVETVLSGPSLLSEAPSSADDGVEPAQTEQASLHLAWFGAGIDRLLSKVVPRADQVGTNIGRGLVRHLDAGLHETLWHVVHRREWRGLGTEKAPEIFVRIF